ncbi:15570_t:CDS:2, partial [Gigaspora rosea]
MNGVVAVLSAKSIAEWTYMHRLDFYESYPVDYEEDKGTYLTSVPNTLLYSTKVNDEENF